MNESTTLKIEILPDTTIDSEKLEKLTQTLQRELEGINEINNVKFVRETKAPDDTMAADPITIGSLLVTLAASGGVLTSIIDTIKARLTQNNITKVSLNGNTIELPNLDETQKTKLIDEFMKQSSKSPNS